MKTHTVREFFHVFARKRSFQKRSMLPKVCPCADIAFAYRSRVTATTSATVTTTPTTLPGPVESCAAGCRCLAPDKADPSGYSRCNSTATACSYDPLGRPMYCYDVPHVTPVSPVPADGILPGISPRPPSDGPVPGVTRKTTTPSVQKMVPMRITVTPSESTSAPDIFSSISRFFSTLLTGREAVGVSPGGGGVIRGCPFGTILCDDECVDLNSDWMNCGRCRNICPGQLPLCCNGTCSSMVSAANCGSCGNACDSSEPCTIVSGWAVCSPAGCEGTTRSTDCGVGRCIDLEWDSAGCGSCWIACPAHSQCIMGNCTPCSTGTDRCGYGSLAGGGFCEDIVSNPWSCGGCGIVCDPDKICEAGTCVSCPAGKIRCGSSCVDLNTDRNNCGTCGNYCYDASSGGTTCCAGQCTELQTNETHCGSCGRTCSASQACIGGTCLLMPDAGVPDITCRLGQTVCNRMCVSLESDESNCGVCGHACSSGQVCSDGECLTDSGCGTACDRGETCCNGICVDTSSDFQRCGSCTNQCPYPQTCEEGRCLDTRNDRNNCGGTGIRCGSDETCCNGHCTDTQANSDNCGSCGNRCHFPGEICCNGSCVNPSSDNNNCTRCGGTCIEGNQCCGNGCYDLRWDENACGSCYHHCPWNKECQNGVCCLWGTLWGCD